jgi:hypothetical protein
MLVYIVTFILIALLFFQLFPGVTVYAQQHGAPKFDRQRIHDRRHMEEHVKEYMEGRRTGHGVHHGPPPPHHFQQPGVPQPPQPDAPPSPDVTDTPPAPTTQIVPDIEVPMPEIKSDADMEFHFFRSHDLDHNNKLDGLEIVKSFLEEEEEERHEESKKLAEAGGSVVEAGKRPVLSDEELITAVEEVLKENDRNHDGYIDLSEFVQSVRQMQEQQQQGQNQQQQQQQQQQPAAGQQL